LNAALVAQIAASYSQQVTETDKSTTEGVLRRGRFLPIELTSLREFARSPLLSAGGKLRAARLALELARQRGQLDLHRPELAAALESDDAATDLAALGGSELRDFAVGPLLESWLGASLSASSDAFAIIASCSARTSRGGASPSTSRVPQTEAIPTYARALSGSLSIARS